jgi:glycosyltransferase involved in cell wall biosynthesis
MVVSPSLGEYVSRSFNLREKPQVVTNGFDSEELENVKPATSDHFSIVYAGLFLPPDIAITPLMKVLQKLKQTEVSRTHAWRFHYYGKHEDHVREKAEECGVLDKVTFHGFVPRADVLSAIRGANVAVVITSIQEQAPLRTLSIVTGKVFEPVGLGTPVLLMAPRGSDASAIVKATGAGGHFTASEMEKMVSFLTEMMTGRKPKPTIPLQYSWGSIAREMDAILRGTIRG